MSNAGGVPTQIEHWKGYIENFLRRHPEFAASNTRGYFRLLEEMQVIDKATADKLCQLDAQGALVRPETFVRVRRELIEDGKVWIAPAQKKLLDDAEGDVREHYRGR